MGKGKPRAVERGGGLGHLTSGLSTNGSLNLNIPLAPVYYPTEEEFQDPLEFIYKIRAEAESYGICKIVPPNSWKAPFALDLNSFTFPTKTQAIHQLQARPASCDSKTFELEYLRFLEAHCGRKSRRKVIFEGEELDLCKLFNAVKRFGGYDKVNKEKKWGEVFRFVSPGNKISECAKYVLSQLYREHLYDYEEYYCKLHNGKPMGCKRGIHNGGKGELGLDTSSSRKRQKSNSGETIKVSSRGKDEGHDQICGQCKSGLHGEVMLLCDRCNKGWHIYCLSPPLESIPLGNWYCLECLNSDEDSFGFVPGKHFSLEAFRKLADRTKKRWFGTTSCTLVQIEKKFWEIVEGSLGEVEVLYGSDLDTSMYGSGFPRSTDQRLESVDADAWDQCCNSPWNLNNLPKVRGSMLRAIHNNIAGVMVPWLYIGMLFSAFCWHFEDHCFYSMNYHHWGEPKCWYSVPGSEASAFEKVMRSCLPDLFDAQPDLLFQLVTMLNPSVLQENDVPVYSVLQEPGNFVITFPRSYHGGFNFGLNCAEAVNFAPADWLPHGGFASQLYQLYHKPAVLSHEELLCVVAQIGCDSKVATYMNKELLRVFTKEKIWRERLWMNGFVKTSIMATQKTPNYVGTEEDPTCIICQQFLYLSAVVCHCRPATFVCLEHWELLCECSPRKRCLLYRHSLSELEKLISTTENVISDCSNSCQLRSLPEQDSCYTDSGALTKKVKGKQITFSQLAEDWLATSGKIFQLPFSSNAYANALKEAQQFLWAGSEMDLVQHMVKNLVQAKDWAESVRQCLSDIESWSNSKGKEKVSLEHIDDLLKHDPLPCNEPVHLKLKEYAEEARILVKEIADVLLEPISSVSTLENLQRRASNFSVYVNESDELAKKISSVKIWLKNARKSILETLPAAISIEFLYNLKSEMLELQMHVLENEKLLELVGQTELCQARCKKMLNGPIALKELELLVQEFGALTVKVPELELLQQYYHDTVSWISRFNRVLVNIHEREDQQNVIDELQCIQKDGSLLKVQVVELACVEAELSRACCREKALKVRRTKVTLDFVQQVLSDAAVLQIDEEQGFVSLSKMLAAAISWEEKARKILADQSKLEDFENAIRNSEGMSLILPSLPTIKDAFAAAKFWLESAKPFIKSSGLITTGSSAILSFEGLKEQVLQSKLLKVSLAEQKVIEDHMRDCEEWISQACSSLSDLDNMINCKDTFSRMSTDVISDIDQLRIKIHSVTGAGLSLGYDFLEIPMLQNASSTLEWCAKVLLMCRAIPSHENVGKLIEAMNELPTGYAGSFVCTSLIDGVSWLQRAVEILSVSCGTGLRKFYLADAEDILVKSQILLVSFPAVAEQLQCAIGKHKWWQEKVTMFFSIDSSERSWSSLIQLKELAKDAFNCSELKMVVSEFDAVRNWMRRCEEVIGYSAGDMTNLLTGLCKIKQSLHRSSYIYEKSSCWKVSYFCTGCSSNSEDQEFITCPSCKDCYHFRCLVPKSVNGDNEKEYVCQYCMLVDSGSISRSKDSPLKYKGKRPQLEMLVDLCSDAKNFTIRIEEKDRLVEIVDQALACRGCLSEIVDSSLSLFEKDVSSISKKLAIVLKALDVAGICDSFASQKFDRALARHSWRIRARKLIEGPQKPVLQQVQRHLKEGLAINVPPEDYFKQKLLEVKQAGMRWAELAKKVISDNGDLELDKVFELIVEGENLPIHYEKELKLLRARSILYCICRRPYDQRSMIACDQCDEWYHFDCVNLVIPPKIYICPACKPQADGKTSVYPSVKEDRNKSQSTNEPQTPSPRPRKSQWGAHKPKPRNRQKASVATENSDIHEFDQLLWRNRKPFRRTAKKRTELGNLLPFFNLEH